jgi:hypothetical protein
MKVPILPMPQFPILGLGLTVLYQCHDLCSPIRVYLCVKCYCICWRRIMVLFKKYIVYWFCDQVNEN